MEQRLLRRETREADYAEQMRHHLGPAMQLFEDPHVAEVYVNPGNRRVWVEDRREGRLVTGIHLEPDRIRAFLNTVADRERETLGVSSAHIAAQLPLAYFEGARLQGFLPRLVKSPCFVARKRPDRVYPLAEYVEKGMMTAVQHVAILRAIAERKNILVAGGTGSGKTTLVNAILKGMTDCDPADRFMILEDTPELRCEAADQCTMKTTLMLDLADLVKLTLRASPDRIIVGEVRDGAALHLMDGWVTGHPGGAGTVHATTPRGALRRMERLARRLREGGLDPLFDEPLHRPLQDRPEKVVLGVEVCIDSRLRDAHLAGESADGETLEPHLAGQGVAPLQEAPPRVGRSVLASAVRHVPLPLLGRTLCLTNDR